MMIDAGIRHEDATGGSPSVRVASLRERGARTPRIPDKLSHGSDFPYRRHSSAIPLRLRGTGLRPSFAVGGLSTVWGGAVLPYAAADIADWPFAAADLAEGYAAAAELLKVAGIRDDLDDLLPAGGALHQPMPVSRQAQLIYDRMVARRTRLRGAGIVFGQSRLAVTAEGCDLRGRCLAGCPLDLIYCASKTLAELRRQGLRYETNVVVKTFRDYPDRVELDLAGDDGVTRTIAGRRAFLGAGVVNTAEIVLRSLPAWPRTVTIRDSRYFIVPALMTDRIDNVESEKSHALSQIFVELLGDPPGSVDSHLQVYSYSSTIHEAVADAFGRFSGMLPLGRWLGRVVLLQGYLPSARSGTIALTLRRDGDGEHLELVGKFGRHTRAAIRSAMTRLLRAGRQTGMWPLLPALKIAEPGRGFHCGGTFPMRDRPGPGETDILGRPAGLSRIHLIDSSLFPSVPATTITLSVMANAHRIALASNREEVT